MTRRRRAGTSLVEAIIAVLVGSIVLVSVWTIFSQSQRQRKMADVTLQGVQEALFFVQPLEEDFKVLCMDPCHPVSVVTGERPGVQFFIYDTEATDLERGTVKTTRVLYSFVPDEHAIYRQEGDLPPRKIRGTFEALDVKIDFPHYYTDMPPYLPDVAPEVMRPGGLLTYMVTCIPVELTVTDRERWRPQDRTILKGALPLKPMNGARRFHFWNPTAPSRPTSEPAGS